MFYATSSNTIRRVSALRYPNVTHQAQFLVMGERLLFQTNSSDLFAIANLTFGRGNGRFAIGISSHNKNPLTIRLFAKKGREKVSKPYPKPVCHISNHLFYLNVGQENSIVVDLAKGEAFGYLTHELVADVEFVRYTFLEAAAQAMLGLARDFVAVHAACVVKNGVSLLLMGDSGVGKSTLAYACVQAGFKLLAEDVVQVKLRPSGAEFWGLPWTLHLLPDSTHFFPELADEPILLQVNGEEKIEVQLAENEVMTHAEKGVFLFLERDLGKDAGIYPIPYETALAKFEVIWSWEIGWQDWYDEVLVSMLQAGAFVFNLGEMPAGSVGILEQFLVNLGRQD